MTEPAATAAHKRLIVLHDGQHPRRWAWATAGCSMVVVPTWSPTGFGQVTFMASGLTTEDGTEIWTRQLPRGDGPHACQANPEAPTT